MFLNHLTDGGLLHFRFLFQIVKQENWLPDSLTTARGTELERLSLLGPFIGLSIFAEDNVSKTQRILKILNLFLFHSQIKSISGLFTCSLKIIHLLLSLTLFTPLTTSRLHLLNRGTWFYFYHTFIIVY